MQSNLLPHALAVEFPELAQAIKTLKAEDAHFAKLLAEHDDLDQIITSDETGVKPVGDQTLHTLKQQRAKLKDELYRTANAAATK